MTYTQHMHTTLNQLAIRTAQNPLGGQLLMLALPLTFAVAAAIITRQPALLHHWAPACGAGTGGSGGC